MSECNSHFFKKTVILLSEMEDSVYLWRIHFDIWQN